MLKRFLEWLFGKQEPAVLKVEVSVYVKEITIKSDSFEKPRTEPGSSSSANNKERPVQLSDEQALERLQSKFDGNDPKTKHLGMPKVKFGDETS